MESVFEVVDHTDDECYYPIGLFRSLEEANAAIDEHANNPPASTFNHIEDLVILEIRQRSFGWQEQDGFSITKRKFRCGYPDDKCDDGVWKEVTQPQEQGV